MPELDDVIENPEEEVETEIVPPVVETPAPDAPVRLHVEDPSVQATPANLLENVGLAPTPVDDEGPEYTVAAIGDGKSQVTWTRRDWPTIVSCCQDCVRETADKWLKAGHPITEPDAPAISGHEDHDDE